MPILEAMATKTPVVVTECTAMPEHLWEFPRWSREENGIWKPSPRSFLGRSKLTGQRGFPIDVEFYTRDPWGNSFRAFASAKSGVDQIKKIMKMPKDKLDEITQRGLEYALSRSWDKAGDVIDDVLKKLIAAKKPKELPNVPMAETPNPPTIPAPIPVQINPEGEWKDE